MPFQGQAGVRAPGVFKPRDFKPNWGKGFLGPSVLIFFGETGVEEKILGREGDGAGFDFTCSGFMGSVGVEAMAVFFDFPVKNGCVSFV